MIVTCKSANDGFEQGDDNRGVHSGTSIAHHKTGSFKYIVMYLKDRYG